MSMFNSTDSFDMDSMPSLSHSDVSSGSVIMDLESVPLENHQAHIQDYGIQVQNDQLQRQRQRCPIQQQQGGHPIQQQELRGHEPQRQLPYQPPQNYYWQTEKQQEQPQYHNQSWQQRPVWPGDVAHYQTIAPTGDNPSTETEMPSLTYTSDDQSTSSSILQSASPHLGHGHLYPGAGPVGPGVGVAMEGSAEDQDDFLVSVLNMIPPEMSSGAAPPPTYYDYEKEFSHRKMLGRGGNGLIRLAFSESRKQQVILKNLQDSQLSPVKAALLFDKEVEVMRICGNHDNIVQFYGIAIRHLPGNEERFMVMDYYKMGDLVNLIGKPQPESPNLMERLFLAFDIAQGLNHLFRCGFHHGDLHPKNILIDSHAPQNDNEVRYRARLTDFGLRRIRDNPSANSSQPVGGVWRFMAPERLPRDRPRYNVLCDIFALGVIYWVLMSGRYPFKNNLTYIPGAREERVENTPDWYHAVYTQAWSETPRERQQTLDEIIQVFEQNLGVSTTTMSAAAPSSLHAESSQAHYRHLMPSSGYYNPTSPSMTAYDRSGAGSVARSGTSMAGSTMVVSPQYSGAPGTTSNHSQTPAQGAAPSGRSIRPNHPRNKKVLMPGMPGWTNHRP